MAIVAVEGTGERRVIVMHGWVLDSGVWLSARANSDVERFTWAYVDFPGYGAAQNEAPVEGIDAMAQVAIAAADELGWDRFSVLGHSMGGAAALRVPTLVPDRVLSTVALTPASPGGSGLDEATYNVFAAAWADPGAAIKGGLAPNIADDDLARLVARNRTSMNQAVWETYLANWANPSFLDALRAVKTPVSLIYGEFDPFVTLEYLRSTAEALQNGTVEQIFGAGHYPMIETPNAVVELYENALSRS